MKVENAGESYCLKHLEALRRQRYGKPPAEGFGPGFFDEWRQEKDKRK